MADPGELGEFLRARRARLQPESVGLPVTARRRVPGLRREELAQLAGVSVDYYVRLEQGRGTHPSEGVLDALSRALELGADEREHLYRLARPATRRRPARVQRLRPQLGWLLDRMDAVPAVVIGPRLEVLAANDLGRALFATDFDTLPPAERNLVHGVFVRSRDVYPDWEKVARETVGQLRATSGMDPDDPELAALVGELSVRSAEFRRLWAEHEVHQKSFGTKRMNHPQVGELELRYETFTLPDGSGQALLTYTAEPGSASEAALRLLGSLTEPVTADS